MGVVTAATEERYSIIAQGNGRVCRFNLTMRYTKKANGMDHLVILRALVKQEIGFGKRAVAFIVVREIVRDNDDDRRNHQSLDVSEDLDTTAISERGIENRDIRFAIQDHRGGSFRVRRFSHDVHACNFLKALLESVAKVGICVGEDDGHQMIAPGVTVF
jgi:hypothetical protein